MDIAWRHVRFDELGGREVHDLLRLRQDVFVVEQDCAFADIDGRDPGAIHVLGFDGSALVACARVFPAGEIAEEAVIGRVVTAPQVRGRGVGRALMAEAVRVAETMSAGAPLRVAAQAHLQPFYESLGFRTVGALYLEDGIPHVDMVRAS